MQELPDAAYRLAGAIVVDSPAAIHEVGDVINPVAAGLVPSERVTGLADLVSGAYPATAGSTRIFDPSGTRPSSTCSPPGTSIVSPSNAASVRSCMNEGRFRGLELDPPTDWARFETIDMHTGGEPLRVIVSGLPELQGKTCLEKRRWFRENLDHVRTALMWEPRGHADMYGTVMDRSNDGDFDVFFLHMRATAQCAAMRCSR